MRAGPRQRPSGLTKRFKMILTTCAACAKPLEHDASSRCVACETRYCSDRCLRYHAHRGGHDDECEEIANGGGAEQHHANKKYEEAVAEAVEECAEDTAGQTCYICLEDGSEEGLVRGCACRGASGVAHVSCLARQAAQVAAERTFIRWHTCGLCEQQYHGVVRCALGWACWKTYVGRPETDRARGFAMEQLGTGLYVANRDEEALSVQEATLSIMRRNGASEGNMLTVQANIVNTLEEVGRAEEAMLMRDDVYSGTLKLYGEEHRETLVEADNYAVALSDLGRFEEAKSLIRKTMPVARRVLGESDQLVLGMRQNFALTLYRDEGSTLADLHDAVTMLEGIEPTARRVLGGAHPLMETIEISLRKARAALRARETQSPSPSESS